MKHQVAQVKNVRMLKVAGDELIGRATGVPGIALLWGATGFGKTTAVSWWANQTNAVYVRACALWTPRAMLSSIMHELGAGGMSSCAPMLDWIVSHLAKANRPLIVDEADYLIGSGRMLDTVRDLHDISTTAVVLIGMAEFQRKVIHRQQLAGRISQWVEFAGADLADARTLADEVCEVEIADDLLEELHRTTHGSMRGLIVGLSRIESYAQRRGLHTIDAGAWAGRKFVMSNGERKLEAIAS